MDNSNDLVDTTMTSEFYNDSYTLDCDAVDTNDIDVKPDLLTLQNKIRISRCEIKQEITHIDIKKEVEDDKIEKCSENPLKVEIKTEENNVELEGHHCNFCGKHFINAGGLKQHVIFVHEGYGYHNCNLCGKKFTQIRNLKKHVNTIHESFVQIKNEVLADNLENHSEVPLKVEIKTEENKVFKKEVDDDNIENNVEDLLKVELKSIHDELENHNCATCGKNFSKSNILNAHIKLVHKFVKKDYKCNFCDKIFTQNVDLKKHIKSVHGKVKDYKCKKSNVSFPKSDSLKRHIKSVHEGVKAVKKMKCKQISTGIKKKKSLNLTMADLDNAAEIEDDEEVIFDVESSQRRFLSKRKCSKQINYQNEYSDSDS